MAGQRASRFRGRLERVVKKTLKGAGYRIERTRPRRGITTGGTQANLLGDPSDLPYRVGDWRYAIPLNEAVGRPCFGYSTDSWHPYVAAAKEILETGISDYNDSVLKRFFDTWHPVSIADSHFPASSDTDEPIGHIPSRSLFEPWLRRPAPCDDPLNQDCSPAGSPLFGPLTASAGEHEFKRLRSMISSIQTFGYDPDGFKRGLIRVVVLSYDGTVRYLIAHGQHRAAILAALGYEVIEVGIHSDLPPLVDTGAADSWPHVKTGFLTAESAVAFATRYFEPHISSHADHVRALVG